MTQLTVYQFNLVVNAFSLAIGALGIATAFFFLQRTEVAPRYRAVVSILGLVTMVATYSYFRLLERWNLAFNVVNGAVQSTGLSYDDTYRYADWLLTVPLLLIVFVLILDLPAKQARVRCFVFAFLAVDMIATGYPGQTATTIDARWFWWAVSMVPYTLIIQQFYIGMAKSVNGQPDHARPLVSFACLLTVLVWCFYPIVYALPLLDIGGTNAFVATQIGYAAADVMAKAVYGVVIYMVAVRKSKPVEQFVTQEPDLLLRPMRAKASVG
jgi:bacteriorhodopsin